MGVRWSRMSWSEKNELWDPNVQGILKGLEINWFLGDQAEEDPEHMEDVFDLLLGRLGRWDLAEVPASPLENPGNLSRRSFGLTPNPIGLFGNPSGLRSQRLAPLNDSCEFPFYCCR